MLAKQLGYIYIDSGAMYRAVSLFYLQKQFRSTEDLIASLDQINIHFEKKFGKTHTILNGKDVEDEIRTPAVSAIVSELSTLPEVRKKLVAEQRRMSELGGIVMDGRDIGTVVFPDADLKIFLTASIKVRTMRRYKELLAKGINLTREEVRRNLVKRDLIDSTREESPLIRAPDAKVLDNSTLDKEEQLNIVLDWLREKELYAN